MKLSLAALFMLFTAIQPLSAAERNGREPSVTSDLAGMSLAQALEVLVLASNATFIVEPHLTKVLGPRVTLDGLPVSYGGCVEVEERIVRIHSCKKSR
jgi:hypothetical protein